LFARVIEEDAQGGDKHERQTNGDEWLELKEN
jgi:hypothetical protein